MNKKYSTNNRSQGWKKTSEGPTQEEKALARFADIMIEKISQMKKSNWQQPWFTDSIGLPRNLDGRRYNSMNSIMLMLHCEAEHYELPVFATFDRIIRMNGHKTAEGWQTATGPDGQQLPRVGVNSGEHGFPVFLTIYRVYHKETREKIDYDDYQELSAEEKKMYNVIPKRKVFTVFNVAAQTNLKETRPELYERLQMQCGRKGQQTAFAGERFTLEPVDYMVDNKLWVCDIRVEHQDKAFFSPKQDFIMMPTKEQFPADYQMSWYGTLFHEMVHSTGSEKRLARDNNSYAREELVAEMGAAMLCKENGMEKFIENDSKEYLKGWLDNMKQDPSFLKTTLDDVKKAVKMIDERIEEVQRDRERQQQIDIREDETVEVAIAEDGDARLVESTVLGADKKQHEEESQQPEWEEEHEEHRRSFHRGR